MTRKLSPEKLEAAKGRRISHTKRDIWPLGMESEELIPQTELDAVFEAQRARLLPGLDRRETVEALALRVVCRVPMSTGHRNLLLKLDLLLESRLEVYQLVLKQKGIRIVQAMSRQAEQRIMLNREEADRAYGLTVKAGEPELKGGVNQQPAGVNHSGPEHNVNTCLCGACFHNRMVHGVTSSSSPCNCGVCREVREAASNPDYDSLLK